MAEASSSPARLSDVARVLAWGVYLACSWTWCIGMFLPVLLVRDFGIWGFVVFALPNIAGAAAMGWVVGSPERSWRMLERHGTAARVFSLATVCFQAMMLAWLRRMAPGEWAPIAVGLFCGVAVAYHLTPRAVDVAVAALVFASSVVGGLWFVGDYGIHAPAGVATPPVLDAASVLWLTPVCVFGFMLCPYLDLTFHRARQELPGRAGSAAFVVGFCVLFPLMILFTLAYAHLFTPLLAPGGSGGGGGAASAWPMKLVLAHISAQLIVTAALHMKEAQAQRPVGIRDGAVFAVLLLPAVTVLWSKVLPADYLSTIGLSIGEVSYRSYMALYGLVFPAYVWIVMMGRREAERSRFVRAVWVCVGAVLVAAPFYWMGFMERRTVWLVPGIGVVLAARLVVVGRSEK